MRGSGTRCDNTGLAFGYSEKTDYLYCGKEWLEFFGIDWYDSKYRYLSTEGIFTSIDPLAEKYPGISPYAYCAGDPVNRVDPEGHNWYSYMNENGETHYKYVQGRMSELEMRKGGYTDLGYTHIDEKGNYYSLFGSVLSMNSIEGKPSLGQLYSKVDDLIIRQAMYRLSEINSYQRAFDFEVAQQPSINSLIDGVAPGHYTFVYSGKSFTSEGDGTYYNIIDPKGINVHGQLVKGDPFVSMSMTPSSGFITRGGIGQNKHIDKSLSGYFIVAKPRSGKSFDSIQIRFGDKKNADAFLSACYDIIGINSL